VPRRIASICGLLAFVTFNVAWIAGGEVEDPVEERRDAFGDQHGCADPADDVWAERTPQGEPEQNHEDACEVRSGLVVDRPRRSCDCLDSTGMVNPLTVPRTMQYLRQAVRTI
jgi:hypothetical protein